MQVAGPDEPITPDADSTISVQLKNSQFLGSTGSNENAQHAPSELIRSSRVRMEAWRQYLGDEVKDTLDSDGPSTSMLIKKVHQTSYVSLALWSQVERTQPLFDGNGFHTLEPVFSPTRFNPLVNDRKIRSSC